MSSGITRKCNWNLPVSNDSSVKLLSIISEICARRVSKLPVTHIWQWLETRSNVDNLSSSLPSPARASLLMSVICWVIGLGRAAESQFYGRWSVLWKTLSPPFTFTHSRAHKIELYSDRSIRVNKRKGHERARLPFLISLLIIWIPITGAGAKAKE